PGEHRAACVNLSTSAPFGSAGQVGGIEEVWVAKIRIAIVGAGNCASSLIQGIEFYRRAEGHDPIPGLMHLELGGYHVGDINCIPVFLAKDAGWRDKFQKRGLPLIGDDIKSQVGATIVHRVLANLFRERGVHLDRTYQLNFGGNSDFQNMLERERLLTKKRSKTDSVTSQMGDKLSDADAHVGPSDYVPWLSDRKWCYIRLEGTTFGNVPLNVELKLEVWDSPNSAGVVINAIRCAKLALDRKIGGALTGPSSYYMKSPPEQFTDYEALARTEAFIRGDAER